MKRNAFTMIELIVVIIIIGILATMALPKFDHVKDLSKVNSELSSMGSLDSTIMAEIEVQSKRFGDTKVNWHNYADMNDTTAGNRATHYKTINDREIVLSKIAKRNKAFKIVGYKVIDKKGNSSYNDGLFCDALVLKVEATKSDTGAKYPVDMAGSDVAGEPDKNDFWVFNASPVDINIASRNSARAPINPAVVPAGELKLIDVNGTLPISNISYIGLSGLTNSPSSTYYFSAPAQ